MPRQNPDVIALGCRVIDEQGWVHIMDGAVMAFMKKHQLIKHNATVLIGVSGGADSLALLHFYVAIREEWNLNIVALSVDHQFRGDESREDLLYVKKMCEKWDVAFEGTSIDVEAYGNERRIGTQLAAREVRYQFYSQEMNRYQAEFLALGHHGDDQVETMFMGLVRSSSPKAISGIPIIRPFSTGYIVRPFLCVTKDDIRNYCQVHHIIPREDPSNEKTDYTRNYFRKKLIPIIKDKNNNIHTTIQRLSESLQEDEHFLRNEAKKMVDEIVMFDESKKEVSLKIDTFILYPSALQRRAYHLILSYLYGHSLPENLSYVHEELFFELLQNHHSSVQLDFPHQLKIEKSYDTLNFSFAKNHHFPLHTSLSIPGEVHFPDGSKLTANITDVLCKEDKYTYICPVNDVTLPLVVRTRIKGDRMSWKGLKGSKKIKDIFIDAKIPRKERDTWPIVTDNNGKVLWLIGLKKGGQMTKAVTGNPKFIQLEYRKANM